MFWHGRRFGNRAIPYLALNLFKSILYVAPDLWMNMRTCFSGLSYNQAFYSALFNVLNTVLISAGFLLLDQDVAFAQEQYVEDAEQLRIPDNADAAAHFENDQINSSVIENFKRKFNKYTENLFDRREWLRRKGIAMNSDGSTNNLADYIHHSRTVNSKSLIFYYVSSLIWAYFCGFFCYTV